MRRQAALALLLLFPSGGGLGCSLLLDEMRGPRYSHVHESGPQTIESKAYAFDLPRGWYRRQAPDGHWLFVDAEKLHVVDILHETGFATEDEWLDARFPGARRGKLKLSAGEAHLGVLIDRPNTIGVAVLAWKGGVVALVCTIRGRDSGQLDAGCLSVLQTLRVR